MKRQYHKKMSSFTVVLLYPDYASDDFGADVYVTGVKALNGESATKKAQREASANVKSYKKIPAADFRMILVFRGDCQVEGDATNGWGL